MTEHLTDRIFGAIYGMAFGDAWGYPTEFMDHGPIIRQSPPPPSPLEITDDTQMSLYNSHALRSILDRERNLTTIFWDTEQQIRVRKIFGEFHLDYEVDEDNYRAPGNTVMGALARYRRSSKLTGLEGSSSNSSKGCGTVMRAPWIGMLPFSRETIITLAILQSETTHGHPQAALSSAVAALILRDIFRGELPLRESAGARERVREMLHATLARVDEVGRLDSELVQSESFMEGISDFRTTVGGVLRSLDHIPEDWLLDSKRDICDWFGQGWVADQALLCAVGAYAIHRGDSYGGIRRLVYSNGDSDSIAAIGGAFLGADTGYLALESQAAGEGVRLRGNFEERYELELSQATLFFEGVQPR